MLKGYKYRIYANQITNRTNWKTLWLCKICDILLFRFSSKRVC